MFIDLICLFVVKSYLHFKRCSISSIAFFTFLDCVLGFICAQCKVDKFQAQMSAVIGNRRNIIKYFF